MIRKIMRYGKYLLVNRTTTKWKIYTNRGDIVETAVAILQFGRIIA